MSTFELLCTPFMLRALAAAVMLAISGGLLSFFVVERRLAFMGHGIAHSMVAGVAIGLLFDWPVLWPAAVVAILVALLIGWASRGGSLPEDSAIGIALSAAMAVGLLAVSLRRGYISHLESYLFGSILAVSGEDLLLISALTALFMFVVLRWWRELLFFAYDSEAAEIAGYPVRALRYALLLSLALMIAVAMKIVGILLIGAFLIIPAASAVMWSARAGRVVLLSVLTAVISALAGIYLTAAFNASAGAMIVLLLVLFFLAGRLWGPYRA